MNKSDKVLPSTQGHADDGSRAKRKKCMIYGAIAGVLVLALVLGLALGLKKPDDGGGDKPDPGPGPGPSPFSGNPYKVDGGSFVSSPAKVSGFLEADAGEIAGLEQGLTSLMAESDDAKSKWEIDPSTIKTGENNQVIRRAKFEVAQVGYKTAHLSLTDADDDRFSIPEDIVQKPAENGQMRLDMAGFKLNKEPFSFSFSSTVHPGEVMLDTKDSTLLLADKYMQMDFKLPSQKIYGFGERTREFTLSEGSWTMWANGQETPYDDGSGGLQTYGVHPFALVQSKVPGEFFGMWFRNANA